MIVNLETLSEFVEIMDFFWKTSEFVQHVTSTTPFDFTPGLSTPLQTYTHTHTHTYTHT